MAKASKHALYVVDGSNIATEGRSAPSLDQLNDAVLAFMDDHPGATVTVVVDATFGHRIAKKEVKAFDEAVANNELVTPPAGAVGRGDAFVLSIADKAKAGVLSNDSFQEFHGDYEWLFDAGRLIGGKPVPHVGWVFVERTPVRGPKSRQSVREAKEDASETKQRANRRVKKKAAAAAPSDDTAPVTPVSDDATVGSDDATSDGARRGRGRRRGSRGAVTVDAEQRQTIEAAKAATAPKEHVNDLMPFLEFVEQHPVGTSCTGVVESYASHGAYARVDDVLIYIPLRLMDDPTPRSARSVLTVGEAVAVVIVGYVPDRRSIDAALPHMADVPVHAPAELGEPKPEARRRASTAGKAPAKRSAAKKSAAKKSGAEKAPAKRSAAKKSTAKKAPAKKSAAAATVAEKAPAKKRPAGTTATEAPAKKMAAKRTGAKKTLAKKAPTASRTGARKTTAKSTAAKSTTVKSTAAKSTAAKSTAAKSTAAKSTTAKKASARKPASRRRSTRQSGTTTDS